MSTARYGDTRQKIVNVFLKMAQSIPLEKITVKMIADELGRNRKTFYYHFDNRSALIAWIFRKDLGTLLEGRFPRNQLIYEDSAKTPTADFPYYIRIKSGVRSFDHAPFFHAFSDCLQYRRHFYTMALREPGLDGLPNYLFNLYRQAFKNDVSEILGNRALDAENFDFLVDFFTGAFVAHISRCLANPQNVDAWNSSDFDNIIHVSMQCAIAIQQKNRSSSNDRFFRAAPLNYRGV